MCEGRHTRIAREWRLAWFKNSPARWICGKNWWWPNWIRVEHFTRIPRCTSWTKSKSYCWDWAKHQSSLLEGSFSCPWSTKLRGDQQTARKNASQMFYAFLYVQRFHQFWFREKNGTLLVKKVYKMLGQNCWVDDVKIWRKRTPSPPSYVSSVQRSTQKPLLRRFWDV